MGTREKKTIGNKGTRKRNDAAETAGAASPETVTSELHEPVWAVISRRRHLALNLTYEQASEMIRELEREGRNGLCIVTNEAAKRVGR